MSNITRIKNTKYQISCDATVTCSFDKNVMNLTVIKKIKYK